MRKLFVCILWLSFFTIKANAQESKILVESLNNTISGLYQPFTLYSKLGSLEQNIDNYSQRFRLEDMNEVKVSKNSEGFSVDISCSEKNTCVNIIKKNNSVSQMSLTSYFFTDENVANIFAQQMAEVIKFYNKQNITTIYTKEPIVTTQIKETNKEITAPEVVHKPKTYIETKIKEEEKELIDDVDEKETKSVVKKNKKDKSEEDDGVEKKTPQTKEEYLEAKEEKNTADFCKQLKQILQICSDKKVNTIEGAVTNAAKKINESKLKLKGAKRNYISDYKSQRTFIAEFKAGIDYDATMEGYDNLQALIDECLGTEWDSNEVSDSKDYENFEGDVKDYEYIHADKKINATLHLILIGIGKEDEEKKYNLLIRIQ